MSEVIFIVIVPPPPLPGSAVLVEDNNEITFLMLQKFSGAFYLSIIRYGNHLEVLWKAVCLITTEIGLFGFGGVFFFVCVCFKDI